MTSTIAKFLPEDFSRLKRAITNPLVIRRYISLRINTLQSTFLHRPGPAPGGGFSENLSRNEAEFLDRAHVLESLPTRLTIIIGKQCNLSCRMCGYPASRVRDNPAFPEWCMEEFRGIYRFLTRLYINGGEPFLYDATKRLMKTGLGNGNMRTTVTTNLSILDEESVEHISTGRVDLSVSLDSATPSTYSRIRTNGDFRKTVGNIARTSVYEGKTQLNFIVMKENHREIEPFVDLARDLGATHVNYQRLKPNSWDRHAFYNEQRVDDDPRLLSAVAESLRRAGEKCREYGIGFSSNLYELTHRGRPARGEPPHGGRAAEMDCRSLWNHIYVNQDTICVCPWSSPRFFFTRKGIRKVWNSRLIRRAREDFALGRFGSFCTLACPRYSAYTYLRRG